MVPSIDLQCYVVDNGWTFVNHLSMCHVISVGVCVHLIKQAFFPAFCLPYHLVTIIAYESRGFCGSLKRMCHCLIFFRFVLERKMAWSGVAFKNKAWLKHCCWSGFDIMGKYALVDKAPFAESFFVVETNCRLFITSIHIFAALLKVRQPSFPP